MGNFFVELKRRHIYRVAAAYAVVAWLLLQLFSALTPILELPEWAGTLVLVFLIGGFPIALLFAWIHQVAADRETATASAMTTLDYVLASALVAVLGLVSYQQIWNPRNAGTPAASIVATGGVSIAVLPFANMSGDAGQEYFSDGITEEINAALAKISDLRVIARTSAFQFKGENQDVRTVGQALGANHLIEGSVRKAGDRVRINAQLVRAADGVQLWSENYDRDFVDIFAIQEEIAQAIAGALRVPLGLPQGVSLVPNRTNDLDSYQQYLLARSQVRKRDIDKAIAILAPLVERDASFAPASALLAYAYFLEATYSSTLRSGSIEEVRRAAGFSLDNGAIAARRAIQLDSENAFSYGALASIEYGRRKWADADDLFNRALALDPNDPEILHIYGTMLAAVGRLKDAFAIKGKVQLLEPFVPIYTTSTARVMQISGQYPASIPLLETVPADSTGGYFRNVYLAQAYAAAGRFNDAADTVLSISGNQVTRRVVEDAARLLRQAPRSADAPESLPKLDGELGFAYAYVGAPERVLEYAERNAEIGFTFFELYDLWDPEHAELRNTERVKALMRKVGLVEYWRARGWGDHCRPQGADDFVCD